MRSAVLLFGFVTALASALANGQGRSTLTVADLRCEYLQSPLGIDVAEPRLSWRLESTDPAARNQHQSAYRILVASDPDRLARLEADLWDSGDVKSDQSVHVPYGGKALGSRARCWWKVQVRNEAGRESAWSEAALWTMGLLKPEDWGGAKWIGLDGGEEGIPLTDFRTASWVWYPEGNPAADAPAATRYFRRTFELPPGTATVARAECFIAADDAATVFLNGKHIATVAGHPNLVRVELPGSALRGGTNVIAVAATNGAAPVAANPAGLICCLRVEFNPESGKPRVMATDDGWRASDREVENWNEPAFDDAAWVNAKSLGPIGIAPWGDPYGQTIKSEHRRLPARMLRREFRAGREIRRATATVCGLGFYELYLNGKKVGDRLMDPGLTEYTKRCLYATYDVTDRITPGGDNAIGVILGNGRFFAPRLNVPVPTVTYGYPKLLLNLRIEYADGSMQDVVSDQGWKVTADGPIRANNEYDGEEYDARLEQDGWDAPGFDDAKWQPAQLVDAPGGALHAQMIEPVRVTERLKPVAISEPKPGVFVVDFGQAFYGVPELTLDTATAGQRIEMRSSFGVRPNGTLNVDNDRTAQNTDVYTTRGSGQPETWSPRFKGNAIHRVQVTGFPGKLEPRHIEGLVVHTDHPAVGEFACSNGLINLTYLNARWGTRLQNRSIPMEPDRDERQGWSGHPAKTSESEGYCFNVAPFYASWLHSVRLDQHADGALQEISPGYWTFGSKGTVWPAVVTIIPNWLHDFYGDERALADNYDAMRKWVSYHERTNQRPDGTLDHASYPDWVDASWIGKRHDEPSSGTASMPFISTAYHYHNARLAGRAAKLLGNTRDAGRFEVMAAKVKAGFNARFFKPAEDKYDFGNQFSYVLPLAFGLVPEDHRQGVIDNLVQQVMVHDKGHTTVGLLGMQWQMQVLTDVGHPEVAYSIATRTERPSWGYMIAKGATTIWERWDTDTQDGGMNGESQKILSGNFEAWCYQTLAGINYDPARPGFKHVILRPHPVGDLAWVKASHKSMYGTIASEWKIVDGGAFRWDVTVPPNTRATVYVPWGAVHEVGSGAYTFESRKP